MPGRGAAGTAGVGGLVRRATMSGRGGTTGRATGCPARFGFAGGLKGTPPPIEAGACGACGAAGAPGRAICLGPGTLGADRGTPGIATDGAVLGISPTPGGSGCRGPERI